MKRFLVALITLVALVASAQAWDVEAGREFALTPDGTQQAWYAFARYNLPLTSEVLGAQLWLLPEAGVWVPEGEPYHGYARLQLLLDQTYGTLFVDARMGSPPGPYWPGGQALVRIGVRFGWPP